VNSKQEIPKSPIALLIFSGGGMAEPAYRLAAFLRNRCGSYWAIVPRLAKSAATLLSLGASEIYLGEDGDLGPLDAQYYDADAEEDMVSALDEVQAVEALEESAIESAYKMMVLLNKRTGKKINTLLPHALKFAAEITKPLFDKIDSVRYSRQSRRLQEAQDYAERLLLKRFNQDQSRAIARDLVRNYPTHGFVIDREESKKIGKMDNVPPVGLQVQPDLDDEWNEILSELYANSVGITAIGRIKQKVPSP
jgi:hypothetical protein